MFYTRFALLCKKRGHSPSYVAEKCGISKMSVSRWKSGSVPGSDLVAKLAKYLGVSTDYLIDGVSAQVFEHDSAAPVMIPIIGDIAAGSPITAEENIEGYAVSDTGDPQNYFYLRIRGDSMINAGIKNGALVLVKRQSVAENKQIVACILSGDSATLKRFSRDGDTITLTPENPLYSPITLPLTAFDTGEAMLLGVAVRVVTDL